MDARANFYGECDLGSLCVTNAVDLTEDKGKVQKGEEWLKSLALRGAQLIVDKLFELPAKYEGDVPIVKLPEPTIVLPRAKPIPKPKPLTKWEKFAKEKGIQKTKKEKVEWDEASKQWRPTYGYKSKANDKTDWLIEIPPNSDPYKDYFKIEKDKKAENIAKNEYQRLRNLASASKTKISALETVDKASKKDLLRSVATAKEATASKGKFTPNLPKEKPPKNSSKKRKFETNIPSDMIGEKQKNLKILEDINKKKPKLDIKEAVQLDIQKTKTPSKAAKKKHHEKFERHKKMLKYSSFKNRKERIAFKKTGRRMLGKKLSNSDAA